MFPLEEIKNNQIGFDFGRGSGRLAKIIAKNFKKLNCIDH